MQVSEEAKILWNLCKWKYWGKFGSEYVLLYKDSNTPLMRIYYPRILRNMKIYNYLVVLVENAQLSSYTFFHSIISIKTEH